MDWNRIGFLKPLSQYPVQSITVDGTEYIKPTGIQNSDTYISNIGISGSTSAKKITLTIAGKSTSRDNPMHENALVLTNIYNPSGSFLKMLVSDVPVSAVGTSSPYTLKYSVTISNTGIANGYSATVFVYLYSTVTGEHLHPVINTKTF